MTFCYCFFVCEKDEQWNFVHDEGIRKILEKAERQKPPNFGEKVWKLGTDIYIWKTKS